jgi:CMP/dCMP kinase
VAIITISRMYGSGGSLIGARVAELLGWSLVDNEFIDEVARRLGVGRDEVAAREERVPSLAERLASTLALASPETVPHFPAGMPPTEEDIVSVTRRVVTEVVAAGAAVLVGRGAQCMLEERRDAFHVYCHAPMHALARRVAGRHSITIEQARADVEKLNRQREQYVKRNFDRDWRTAALYHLSIDTEWFGIEGSAELIARLAREKLGAISTASRSSSGS